MIGRVHYGCSMVVMPMFNKYPLFSRFVMVTLLPLALVLFLGYRYTLQSLPPSSGQQTVVGLLQPSTITFDKHSVPTVVAQSDRDAYFAQGYLHASNRMWQLALQRRLVQGRLSEVFGRTSLSSDIWMRTLGIVDAAKQAQSSLSADANAALEAYAKGINAWLETTDVLPPEFAVFNLTPAPWQPIDSLAWQKLFALNLGQNLYGEVNRMAALKLLNVQQLKTFFPYDEPITPERWTALKTGQSSKHNENNASSVGTYQYPNWQALAADMTKAGITERFVGSNGWVVGPQHTKSKAAIVANDPHLSIHLPSLWYAIQLKGDKVDAKGMSLVGLPGIILGRNRHISWGATSLMADQQDLFMLDIPLNNSEFYRTDEGLAPITTKEELIHVRREAPAFLRKPIEPVKVMVRSTTLGPIVTDVINSGKVMALRWAALDKDDHSYEAFYRLQYADNWSDFKTALKWLKAPGLHFLYADEQGNIGAQVAAALPNRGAGTGVLPQPADKQGNYWQGYVDFERLPAQYNPPSGIIVSANNHIPSQSGVVISHEWAPKTRFNRITQLLQQYIDSGQKLTIDTMSAIQHDQLDLGAQQLQPLLHNSKLRSLIEQQADTQWLSLSLAAFDLLSQWDGDFSAHSSGAAIYHYWLEGLKKQIFADELERQWSGRTGSRLTSTLTGLLEDRQLQAILTDDKDGWCDKKDGVSLVCQHELITSFLSAVKQLQKYTDSSDLADWQWGQVHFVEYAHRPFGSIKLLDQLFSTRKGVGGSNNTVNVANARKREEGDYVQTFGPVFRQIFDHGEDNGDAYLLSNGQSGHLLSDHNELENKAFFEQALRRYVVSEPQSEQQANALILQPGEQ